jgi:hypothetical protein
MVLKREGRGDMLMGHFKKENLPIKMGFYFSRLRLKLATIYASLIDLERVGETAVTNVQLTNGDLVVCVYGWDKVSKKYLKNFLLFNFVFF